MQKYLNKLQIILISSVIFLAACKKEGTNVLYTGGTAPVLSATLTGTIPLSYVTGPNQLITFSWTNPDYQFSNGISSLNVTYNLEFDTLGANFTSPHMQTVQISPNLSTSFTVATLNSLLANGLQLDTGNTHNLQVRVVSFIAPYTSGSPNIASLNSAPINFTVKPFAPPPVVAPPAGGVLILVGGDALLGAWTDTPPTSQQFTAVTATDYQLTIALSGGDPTNGDDQYLLLPQIGNFSNKYACQTTSSQPFSGGSFGLNVGSNYNDNFPGPTAAGNYLFDVNFQTGILTVTKQ